MKFKFVLISSILLLLIGVGVCCYGMSGLDWDFNALMAADLKEMSYSAQLNDEEKLDLIEIDVASTTLTILQGDDNNIKVDYQDGSKDSDEFYVEYINNKLFVRMDIRKSIFNKYFFKNYDRNITITLPINAIPNLDVDSSNLKFIANNLTLGIVDIDAANINMDINDSQIGEIKADCSNIDFSTKNVVIANLFDVDSANVDIDATNLSVKIVKIDSANTNMDITDTQMLELKIGAANCYVAFDKLTSNIINISSASNTFKGKLVGKLEDYKIDIKGNKNIDNQSGNGSGKSITIKAASSNSQITFID